MMMDMMMEIMMNMMKIMTQQVNASRKFNVIYKKEHYSQVIQVLGPDFNQDEIYKWLEKFDGNVSKTVSKLLGLLS